MNSYQVKENNTFDFKIDTEAILNLDSLKVSDLKFHILQNNTSYKTEIIKADFNQKSYSVKVNNNTFNVTIFNQLDALIN